MESARGDSDMLYEIFKHRLLGEAEGEVTQLVTGDRFAKARGQLGKR